MSTIIDLTNILIGIIARLMETYSILLTIKITLAWFPTISFYYEPIYTLHTLTLPFLNRWSGLLPPIFGMDLSPVIGMLILQGCTQFLFRVHFEY